MRSERLIMWKSIQVSLFFLSRILLILFALATDLNDSAAAKRARAFLPPGTSRVMCTGSTASLVCANLPAVSCFYAACSSCCMQRSLDLESEETKAAVPVAEAVGGVCEIHGIRLEKQKEKKLFKKQARKKSTVAII